MTGSDRIAADNPAVETHRATVARIGRTNRPRIDLPASIALPDNPIRLVLDGTVRFARLERGIAGEPGITGAYDSPAHLREGSDTPAPSPNRLTGWVEATELSFGRTVLLDVVDPGRLYGLRVPGTSALYEVGQPDTGLAAIAETIQDRDVVESSGADESEGPGGDTRTDSDIDG